MTMSTAPLDDLFTRWGAAWGTDQAGRRTVLQFGAAEEEYRAATTTAAAFPLPDRVTLQMTGADRQKFLHNFSTNDIRRLQPGEGCEAFIPTLQGKVRAHVFVYATADALWIDSAAGTAEKLVPHLSRYVITEDVEIHDRTAEWSACYVTGPAALERLGFVPALPVYRMEETVDLFGVPVQVRRADWFGKPGVQILAAPDQMPVVWEGLRARDIRPAGDTAFQAVRIEAHFPEYGLEITDANLAQEVARTTQAISFTKGCYLGQEPIARIDALGHVNQELRSIRFEAGPLPPPGTELFAPGGDKPLGRVTSSALAAAAGPPIALAYLRRSALLPGTPLVFRSEGKESPGTVFVG